MVSVFVSCKQNNNNASIPSTHVMNDSTMMNNDSTMMRNNAKNRNTGGIYSCPMHPEIHGNQNDKCSVCGMNLEMTNPKTTENSK